MKKLNHVLILVVILTLVNCQGIKRAQKNLAKKRVEKLINKYNLAEDTSETISRDTIFMVDTFTIPEREIDTVFKWELDTTYIVQKDGVETKILITTDTIKLDVYVDRIDTLIETKEIIKTVDRIVKVNTTPEKKDRRCWVIDLFIAIFVVSLFYILKRVFNV